MTTDYPWEGKVTFRVAEAPASGFGLRLRAPSWCTGPLALSVNGAPVSAKHRERGYLLLERPLRAGDEVVLDLPMPVRRVEADPRVEEAAGRVALQRGPLVYCAEQVDHDRPLALLALPPAAPVRTERDPALLGGVVRLVADAVAVAPEEADGPLYREARGPRASRPATLTAVPYGTWDNRAAGPMKVWVRTA